MFEEILIIGSGSDINLALELYGHGYSGKVNYYSNFVIEAGAIPSGTGFDRFGINIVEDLFDFLSGKRPEQILVIITDCEFDDLADLLREKGVAVFGPGMQESKIEKDIRKTFDVLSEMPGVEIETSIVKGSLAEIEEIVDKTKNVESMYPFEKEDILVLRSSAGNVIAEGKIEDILSEVQEQSSVERELKLGYVLERKSSGVDFSFGTFFNGRSFCLSGLVLIFESDFGGMVSWETENEAAKRFLEVLQSIEPIIAKQDFNGFVTLSGTLTDQGTFLGKGISFDFDLPWAKAVWKMCDNLFDVLSRTAVGEDIGAEFSNKCCTYVHGFANIEGKDETDFSDLGEIYKEELVDTDRFGISFDQAVMDQDGRVNSMPGSARMVQIMGLGSDYFHAVDNLTDVYRRCKSNYDFEDSKQDAIEDMRDKSIFFYSWVDLKEGMIEEPDDGTEHREALL